MKTAVRHSRNQTLTRMLRAYRRAPNFWNVANP
jgi:hypothetical protein